MDQPSIKDRVVRHVRYSLQFLSDVGFPDRLEPQKSQFKHGYEVFEALIPGITEHIATIIYEESFGQVSGSHLMQAVKIKTMMAKHYAHLTDIIGETRFEKFVDFPTKIRTWRLKGLSEDDIEEKFVKSVVQIYLTASKRDPGVFQLELIPLVREWVKKAYDSHFPEQDALRPLLLDNIAREFLKTIDLGRVPPGLKGLIRDFQTYCQLIFFINKFEQYGILSDSSDMEPTLNLIRTELGQIIGCMGTYAVIGEKLRAGAIKQGIEWKN